MKIAYIEKRFSAKSEAMIEAANKIVAEYAKQGFSLTLRQLYYQFVARDKITNDLKSYKRMGSVISDARRAGRIDWNAIEDRTRAVRSRRHWDSPQDVIVSAAASYGRDLWVGQKYRPQVWIEKDALIGVIEGVCGELDVSCFSCRGYVSDSAIWRAGRAMRGNVQAGQTPVVIHLGDHDPSGCDMSRDITERLAMFAGADIQVARIALNYEQVEEYKPPPNPAKLTDSRAAGYVADYGDDSWELDALEPSVIVGLVREAVEAFLARDAFEAERAVEVEHKGQLRLVGDYFDQALDAARIAEGGK